MTLLSSHFGLPASNRVDPGPLETTFDDKRVTNSYKHLLFRVLLRDCVESGRSRIDFETIVTGMMEEAWWPGIHHGLKLGHSDKIVERMRQAVGADVLPLDPGEIRRGSTKFEDFGSKDSLLHFVPQRLIRSWFDDEVRDLPDHQIDPMVKRLSCDQFRTTRPIYRILDDGLDLHPEWIEYLSANMDSIKIWSDAMWVRFLESRNPDVEGLAEKIMPGFGRFHLGAERALWNMVMDRCGVTSVYSGKLIGKGDFELDHFLPRAFVTQDKFWNITPVERHLRALKDNSIPDLAFIPHLARQHSIVAREATRLSGGAKFAWDRALDQYAADLRLSGAELLDEKALESVYNRIFSGRVGIAKRMGFSEGWRPNVRDLV